MSTTATRTATPEPRAPRTTQHQPRPLRLRTAPTHDEETDATWIDELLRTPEALVARITAARDLRELVRTLLAVALVGSAVFGAAVGTYRGGAHILATAVKLPLAVLGTAVLCAPALWAANEATGRGGDLRRDFALLVAALARAAVFVGALAPVLLVVALPYDRQILVVSAIALAGGLFGATFLYRACAVPTLVGRDWVVGAVGALALLVASQLVWVTRPYVVHPEAPDPPALRALDAGDSGFLDALGAAASSAFGYGGELRPLDARGN